MRNINLSPEASFPLERDVPMQARIVGEVDLAHAARADEADDLERTEMVACVSVSLPTLSFEPTRGSGPPFGNRGQTPSQLSLYLSYRTYPSLTDVDLDAPDQGVSRSASCRPAAVVLSWMANKRRCAD